MYFTCPQGHQWERPAETEAAPASEPAPCPLCAAYAAAPPTSPLLVLRRTLLRGQGEEVSASCLLSATLEVLPRTASAPPAIPGYTILEELGQGGMGVVYKAWQADLNRPVVIKMMLAGELARPRDLARFRAEAEAVARLQHPNIVQIYDVGETDGRPYFTLEYVEGRSLDHLLGGKPLPPRAAAELLETLAQAVQAAHGRGIVHRDLKPANVLIRNDGVAKLTDFGLARRLEDDPPGADRLTQSGTVVGTPSYMPPEQACGRSRDVGPAGDTYALGAILYETLTGRPPFLAASWVETLHQVRFQEPLPPRQLQPKLPRDLEIICLKCLQKEPARRYASAEELADDLRRCLDRKPIRARPTPLWEKTAKWLRRHPVGAFALLTATALVTLGIWHLVAVENLNAHLQSALTRAENEEAVARAKTAQLEAEKKLREDETGRANTATGRAAKEFIRADENLLRYRQSVRRFFTEVSRNRLLEEPGLKELRRDLFKMALLDYEKFVAQQAHDPELLAEQGWAYVDMGRISNEVGPQDRALRFCRQAADIFTELTRTHPDRVAYKASLASCHYNLGVLHAGQGRTGDAETAYRKALDIQQELARTHKEAAHVFALADTLSSLGALYAAGGRVEPAEKAYCKALALRKSLADRYPAAADCAYALAVTCNNLGLLYRNTGRSSDAETAFGQALDVLGPLVEANPRVADYRSALAAGYTNRSILSINSRRLTAAESDLREGVRHFGQLVRDHPQVAAYKNDLACAHHDLGNLFRATHRDADALKAYEQALSLREELVKEHNDTVAYRSDLASTCNNLGILHTAGKRHAEAAKAFTKALELQEPLAQQHPDNIFYQSELGGTYCNLGVYERDRGRPAQAEAYFRKALARQEPLVRALPEAPEFAARLGGTTMHLGYLLQQKQPRAAVGYYDEAVRILEPVCRKHAGAFRFLCDAYAERALTLNGLGEHARALRDWDRLVALNPTLSDERRFGRAATRARLGDHVRAVEEAEEMGRTAATAENFHRMARVYALAADAAGRDRRRSPAQRLPVIQGYANRAVALLSQAEAAGYFRPRDRVAQLRKDKAFAPLHSFEAYQRLLHNLESRTLGRRP